MDHETRVRVLQQIVDEASGLIVLGKISLPEAEAMLKRVRNQAYLLLPAHMETYDLIYHSRLSRLINQFIRPREFAR